MEQFRDIKEEIVNSFIAEFNVSGPKLTLDQVTARIHISKKTIYKYFSSKRAIYDIILERTSSYIVEKQKEIQQDDSIDLKEKLYRILTIVTPYEEVLDTTRLAELKQAEPEFHEQLVDAYSVHWSVVSDLFNQAKAAGVLRDGVDPALLIQVVSGAMSSFLSGEFLKKSSYTYSQAVQDLAKLLLEGALAD